MNHVYKVAVKQNENSVSGHFSPYDITIHADNVDNVLKLLRDVMITEGVSRRDFKPESRDDTTEFENADVTHAYLYIDMDHEFRIRNTASVRKNITLPEWMDIKLRELDVDASKLFQEAALGRILAEERASMLLINSVEDLKKIIPQNILDEFISQTIGDFMKSKGANK